MFDFNLKLEMYSKSINEMNHYITLLQEIFQIRYLKYSYNNYQKYITLKCSENQDWAITYLSFVVLNKTIDLMH